MSQKLFPISSLPLPPSSHILQHNLTPDPLTPTPSTFISEVLPTKPSVQRRARLLSPRSHFSYVNPLPLAFPYEIAPPKPPEIVRDEDKPAYVEKWLSAREATHLKPEEHLTGNGLRKYYPQNRDQPRELIGLAETGLRDCVPQLDVGDAIEMIGTPALLPGPSPPSGDQIDNTARQDLIDVLSGHAVLMSADIDTDSGKGGFAPWSLRYSGHQFGVWAGQLGDGRAISLLAVPHPSDPELTYELQMKGSGRTPFSRSADGLAVLRSSIREFLGSEAMHALQIPTTRSLTLTHLPALPVQRESPTPESACILTRVSPSFIRIGSFEALNAPQGMFFLGGGQQESCWEALRILGEWVGKRVLRLEGVKWTEDDIGNGEGGAWGRKLVLEVARRNAEMVAGWQAYGFMHGVMNTDNISIMGLTIDYGPYAFMDVFDPHHICNHTDEEGRYAYKFQPNMIIYACRHLLNALSPLIGAEFALGNERSVGPNWAQGASDGTMGEWKKVAVDAVKQEMEVVIQEGCSKEYGRLMRKRLALKRSDESDESKIIQPLLNIMAEHKLDFHGTFRKLSYFRPSLLVPKPEDPNQATLEKFISDVLSLSPEVQTMDHAKAAKDLMVWFEKYSERIFSEKDEWASGDFDLEREKVAKSANPRFVLRQWVLEEVIGKVEKDTESGKKILAKVLHMACNPFESWGAEGEDKPEGQLDAEVREERRFCGMGEKAMLGFQCSCSS